MTTAGEGGFSMDELEQIDAARKAAVAGRVQDGGSFMLRREGNDFQLEEVAEVGPMLAEATRLRGLMIATEQAMAPPVYDLMLEMMQLLQAMARQLDALQRNPPVSGRLYGTPTADAYELPEAGVNVYGQAPGARLQDGYSKWARDYLDGVSKSKEFAATPMPLSNVAVPEGVARLMRYLDPNRPR